MSGLKPGQNASSGALPATAGRWRQPRERPKLRLKTDVSSAHRPLPSDIQLSQSIRNVMGVFQSEISNDDFGTQRHHPRHSWSFYGLEAPL
jgi:hypothetical protein